MGWHRHIRNSKVPEAVEIPNPERHVWTYGICHRTGYHSQLQIFNLMTKVSISLYFADFNVSVREVVSFLCYNLNSKLIHWGWVTHICVSKLIIIGSDNGLSPGRHEAIIWANAGILLTENIRTIFISILIEMITFQFKKMRHSSPVNYHSPDIHMYKAHKIEKRNRHWLHRKLSLTTTGATANENFIHMTLRCQWR